MIADFDPAKDEVNRAKHGVPLSYGLRVFEDPHRLVLASHRAIDGEDRVKAVGEVDGKLHTLVHVWRGDVIRLISMRRSNDGEEREYRSVRDQRGG